MGAEPGAIAAPATRAGAAIASSSRRVAPTAPPLGVAELAIAPGGDRHPAPRPRPARGGDRDWPAPLGRVRSRQEATTWLFGFALYLCNLPLALSRSCRTNTVGCRRPETRLTNDEIELLVQKSFFLYWGRVGCLGQLGSSSSP